MKRLGVFLLSILLIYAIYFDLSQGTLPNPQAPVPTLKQERAIEVSSTPEKEISFFEKTVNAGETVLTIIEKRTSRPIPVSIDTVIADFQSLNNGIRPEEIRSGNTYKFPEYSTSNH